MTRLVDIHVHLQTPIHEAQKVLLEVVLKMDQTSTTYPLVGQDKVGQEKIPEVLLGIRFRRVGTEEDFLRRRIRVGDRPTRPGVVMRIEDPRGDGALSGELSIRRQSEVSGSDGGHADSSDGR